jgi:hypothetical protein
MGYLQGIGYYYGNKAEMLSDEMPGPLATKTLKARVKNTLEHSKQGRKYLLENEVKS